MAGTLQLPAKRPVLPDVLDDVQGQVDSARNCLNVNLRFLLSREDMSPSQRARAAMDPRVATLDASNSSRMSSWEPASSAAVLLRAASPERARECLAEIAQHARQAAPVSAGWTGEQGGVRSHRTVDSKRR